MSVGKDGPELDFTVAEWRAAWDALPADSDAAPLLRSAGEDLEHAWTMLRPLAHWVALHPERSRDHDDAHGQLLTFVEADLLDAFRKVANKLLLLVRHWPDFEHVTPDDVELSLLVRYVSVLLLATESASVPHDFKVLVRQLSPLRAGEPWERRLSGTLDAVGVQAFAEDAAALAFDFVDRVLHDLPGRMAVVVDHLETCYVGAGVAPPRWIALLRDRMGGDA